MPKNEVEILAVTLADWIGVTLEAPQPRPSTAPYAPKKVRHFTEDDKQEALRRVNMREFAQDLNFRTR